MTNTMTAPRFSPVLLAEPEEVYDHLLPLAAGERRRKPMDHSQMEVKVHPSFAAAHSKHKRGRRKGSRP